MKIFSTLFLLLIFQSYQSVLTNKVPCEQVLVETWSYIGMQKVCLMTDETSIGSNKVSISSPRDEVIKGLTFHWNKKVLFLPIKIAEVFPFLEALIAFECSLTTISKENFRNLKSLRRLDLDNNNIEKIYKNTFEDLTSLELLDLQSNRIQYLNGAALKGLKNLRMVWLGQNRCINADFEFPIRIRQMPRNLTELCSFPEPSESSSFESECIDHEKLINITISERTKCESTLATRTAEVSRKAVDLRIIEMEMKALKASKKHCESRLNLMQEITGKLDAKCSGNLTKTFDELRREVESVKQENEKLLSEVKKKGGEIKDKDEKIRKLEEKVETLTSINQF